MPSIYLNHNPGLTISESRNSISILSINTHAYGGANLVPSSFPEICCMILVSNSMKLFFNINSAISTKSADEFFFTYIYIYIYIYITSYITVILYIYITSFMIGNLQSIFLPSKTKRFDKKYKKNIQ